MKVSELEGALLDHWVAKAEGHPIVTKEMGWGAKYNIAHCIIHWERNPNNPIIYMPSTYWLHGGPIIERELIDLHAYGKGAWGATHCSDRMIVAYQKGDAPLVAAMRSYVATKFGDEVPDEVA